MAANYQVYINSEVIQALPKSGKRRERLLHFITDLQNIAVEGGDFTLIDPETNRPFQVSILVGFAITWWIDEPVREVKIVDLRPLK